MCRSRIESHDYFNSRSLFVMKRFLPVSMYQHHPTYKPDLPDNIPICVLSNFISLLLGSLGAVPTLPTAYPIMPSHSSQYIFIVYHIYPYILLP